ncbi:hypothetical protein FRB99_004147, partial [Tulasnella sp. 403]
MALARRLAKVERWRTTQGQTNHEFDAENIKKARRAEAEAQLLRTTIIDQEYNQLCTPPKASIRFVATLKRRAPRSSLNTSSIRSRHSTEPIGRSTPTSRSSPPPQQSTPSSSRAPVRRQESNSSFSIPPFDEDEEGGKDPHHADDEADSDDEGLDVLEARLATVQEMVVKMVKRVNNQDAQQGQNIIGDDDRRPGGQEKIDDDAKRPGGLDKNTYLWIIRSYTLKLLRVQQLPRNDGGVVETDYPEEPPDVDTNLPRYPDFLTRFTLAWSKPRRHRFNDFAATVFARGLVNDPEYKTYRFTARDQDAIKTSFLNQWNYLRQKRQKTIQPPTGDETYLKRRYLAKNERRRRLYDNRIDFILATPELHHLADNFAVLGPEGMSSDEDEGSRDGVRTYGIIKKEWRSAELVRFCRTISLYLGATKDSSVSKDSRNRVPSDRLSLTKPPAGLPINWYDVQWRNNLQEADRRILRIDEDVEVQELAIPGFISEKLNSVSKQRRQETTIDIPGRFPLSAPTSQIIPQTTDTSLVSGPPGLTTDSRVKGASQIKSKRAERQLGGDQNFQYRDTVSDDDSLGDESVISDDGFENTIPPTAPDEPVKCPKWSDITWGHVMAGGAWWLLQQEQMNARPGPASSEALRTGLRASSPSGPSQQSRKRVYENDEDEEDEVLKIAIVEEPERECLPAPSAGPLQLGGQVGGSSTIPISSATPHRKIVRRQVKRTNPTAPIYSRLLKMTEELAVTQSVVLTPRPLVGATGHLAQIPHNALPAPLIPSTFSRQIQPSNVETTGETRTSQAADPHPSIPPSSNSATHQAPDIAPPTTSFSEPQPAHIAEVEGTTPNVPSASFPSRSESTVGADVALPSLHHQAEVPTRTEAVDEAENRSPITSSYAGRDENPLANPTPAYEPPLIAAPLPDAPPHDNGDGDEEPWDAAPPPPYEPGQSDPSIDASTGALVLAQPVENGIVALGSADRTLNSPEDTGSRALIPHVAMGAAEFFRRWFQPDMATAQQLPQLPVSLPSQFFGPVPESAHQPGLSSFPSGSAVVMEGRGLVTSPSTSLGRQADGVHGSAVAGIEVDGFPHPTLPNMNHVLQAPLPADVGLSTQVSTPLLYNDPTPEQVHVIDLDTGPSILGLTGLTTQPEPLVSQGIEPGGPVLSIEVSDAEMADPMQSPLPGVVALDHNPSPNLGNLASDNHESDVGMMAQAKPFASAPSPSPSQYKLLPREVASGGVVKSTTPTKDRKSMSAPSLKEKGKEKAPAEDCTPGRVAGSSSKAARKKRLMAELDKLEATVNLLGAKLDQ